MHSTVQYSTLLHSSAQYCSAARPAGRERPGPRAARRRRSRQPQARQQASSTVATVLDRCCARVRHNTPHANAPTCESARALEPIPEPLRLPCPAPLFQMHCFHYPGKLRKPHCLFPKTLFPLPLSSDLFLSSFRRRTRRKKKITAPLPPMQRSPGSAKTGFSRVGRIAAPWGGGFPGIPGGGELFLPSRPAQSNFPFFKLLRIVGNVFLRFRKQNHGIS